ncbi:MAG: biotin--[acetyl-CoA-carboxylase] ligase [Alphaproteobacteria bacterium]|nr:biotin--[acetyl-CoA-carboxylase] ligase [Alphaproteobacteria bacterium]
MTVRWDLRLFEEAASTQDILKDLARTGVPQGTAVQALSQTAGRGRHGREWEPGAGNLYLSVLLRPACALQDIGQLGLVAGVAIGQALAPFLENPSLLRLKWPNDVFLSGKKCAGILIETDTIPSGDFAWAVVGMGVNILEAPAGLSSRATGIAAHAKKNIPAPGRDEVREAILKELGDVFTLWQDSGFEPIRRAWLALAHPPGTPMSVKVGAMIHEGLFQDVDETGGLRLREQDGTLRTITGGEVFVQTDGGTG